MPIQMCPIDIPDGYEFVRYGLPEISGERVLDQYGDAVEMSDAIAPWVIVRPAWQWPEWLIAEWLAMDEGGEWFAFMTEPRMLKGCWDNEDGGVLQCMNSQITAFVPPPCDDWTKSLRKNPRSK